MSVTPTQVRTFDPYASVDSNVFNRVTRLLSNNSDCLLHSNPIVVTKTNDTNIALSTGHCIKDDVLIEISASFSVDMTAVEFYTEFGGTAWSETGYYYVVMKYVYTVSTTAPVATIHLVLPSLLSGWNSSGDYLLLGILNVTDPGTREVTSIIKTDGIETINYSDIGNNLFVDSSGNVEIQGLLRNSDGSVSTPSYSFTNDTDTGIFIAEADAIAITTGGTERVRINSTGLFKVLTGSIQVINGTVSVPSITFNSDEDTGIYRISANTLGFATGGVERLRIDSAGNFTFSGAIYHGSYVYFPDGAVTSPSIRFANDADTGMYRITADTLGFSTGGSNRLSIGATGNVTIETGIIKNTDGSFSSPSYTFNNDPDTGMYRITTNAIGFTCAGTKIFQIDTGGVNITGNLQKSSGTFKIDHPLDPDNKYLMHSFIEGPKCDLIYRGDVNLINGQATVDLDLESKMTPGTFDALNKDCKCWLQNDSGWDRVKGNVNQGILNITCENNNSTDTINWMVVGTRKDKHIIESDITDNNGDLITEVNK